MQSSDSYTINQDTRIFILNTRTAGKIVTELRVQKFNNPMWMNVHVYNHSVFELTSKRLKMSRKELAVEIQAWLERFNLAVDIDALLIQMFGVEQTHYWFKNDYSPEEVLEDIQNRSEAWLQWRNQFAFDNYYPVTFDNNVRDIDWENQQNARDIMDEWHPPEPIPYEGSYRQFCNDVAMGYYGDGAARHNQGL